MQSLITWSRSSLALLILSTAGVPGYLAHASPLKGLPDDFQEIIAHESTPKDAVRWQAVGTRWAAAVNSQGKVIALYDLSYPQAKIKVTLGGIGMRKASAFELIGLLREAMKDASSSDQKDGQDALDVIRDKKDAFGDALPADWWQKLPWKAPFESRAQEAVGPSHFKLSEIHFESLIRDRKKYAELKASAESALSVIAGHPVSLLTLLEGLELDRREDGSYDLSLVSDSNFSASGLWKAADLQSVKALLYRELAWEVYKKAINFLADQMTTAPIAGAILGTAIDRYFHYTEQTKRAHWYYALEMVNAAQNAEEITSWETLSEDERLSAAVSIIVADTGVSSSWKWIFNKPASHWEKIRDKENEIGMKSREWLEKNNYLIEDFSPRFARASTPTSGSEAVRSLYLLGRSYSKRHEPVSSLDYSRPTAESARRLRIEAATIAVQFGSRLLPVYGGIVRKAYSKLVESPLMKTKEWEARLMSQLEQRTVQSRGNFSFETERLDAQRINPMEISGQRRSALIQARKQALGIE